MSFMTGIIDRLPQVALLKKHLDDCLEIIHEQALKIEDLQNVIDMYQTMMRGHYGEMAKCKRKPRGKK